MIFGFRYVNLIFMTGLSCTFYKIKKSSILEFYFKRLLAKHFRRFIDFNYKIFLIIVFNNINSNNMKITNN